ncbi:MAG: sigma-70 family RNA polymerase sigma factor [Deltaproteobacteria bacterium]|nr:sigma-70 family RNA polymerase sigma factor [Deltaproteobacteria bacterium]
MNKTEKPLSIKESNPAEKTSKEIDFQLIKRCRKGDEAAFEELVRKYQKKVFLIALGMVKNPEDAMDIAQEGFVKVHRYLDNFQGTSSFYTWLYRIVFNLSIDHIRKNRKFSGDEYDERLHGSKESANSGTGVMSNRLDTDPSKNISKQELGEKIMEAIDELPEYHRVVIMMREIEGMSYTDMAQSLQVSKGTVMSRLHHARQKLQQLLNPYINGEIEVR